MPLQATSGAASYDAFGGGVPVEPVYIEQIFSTYLYTGTGSSRSITNGIDLAGKGGLVWTACRSNAYGQIRQTSVGTYLDQTTAAAAADSSGNFITAFNSTGFTIGDGTAINNSGSTFASWTFRKQPKFFDVVTYTGDGSGSQTINHNLGSVPGCIIVKSTSSSPGAGNWAVYHTALGTTKVSFLNLTDASYTLGMFSSVTSTSFNVTSYADVNASGVSFVAYVFAHNAGGFGLTGTDNVISCGSFTTDGSSNFSATLGYEPQWVMIKRYNTTGNWLMFDNMRGMGVQGISNVLYADVANAEAGPNDFMAVNSTGFSGTIGSASQSYIYIAIRRGPMKVPTSGTSVFSPSTYTGDDGSNREITGLSFTPDLMLNAMRLENGSGRSPSGFYWFDRLRGKGARLRSSQTLAEFLVGPAYEGVNFRSYSVDAASGESNYNPALYVSHLFKRAPSFFDEVCYTGTGTSGQAFTHNLGVAPELMIVKARGNTYAWWVYDKTNGSAGYSVLNTTAAWNANSTVWGSASPTASVFTVGSQSQVNENGTTFVAYLFATCAGVSKVGSYTGNGSSQTINCGFTGGARFVMVKATSTTGNWIVADSARGIVAGNDPATYINIATSELTSFDWIDADNSGFVVNETSTIAANTNGVTYIFLAIA